MIHPVPRERMLKPAYTAFFRCIIANDWHMIRPQVEELLAMRMTFRDPLADPLALGLFILGVTYRDHDQRVTVSLFPIQAHEMAHLLRLNILRPEILGLMLLGFCQFGYLDGDKVRYVVLDITRMRLPINFHPDPVLSSVAKTTFELFLALKSTNESGLQR